jgi:hypothetical protein
MAIPAAPTGIASVTHIITAQINTARVFLATGSIPEGSGMMYKTRKKDNQAAINPIRCLVKKGDFAVDMAASVFVLILLPLSIAFRVAKYENHPSKYLRGTGIYILCL